jgi:hypothetical protein
VVNIPYSNNPNVLYQAIGIANCEGNTANGSNGLAGMLASDNNPDGGYRSFGPFQFNSGPNALGTTLAQSLGLFSPGQATLDQQSHLSSRRLAVDRTAAFAIVSVNDSGGIGNITNAGRATFQNAQLQGIIGAGQTGDGPSDSHAYDPDSGIVRPVQRFWRWQLDEHGRVDSARV